MVEADNQRRSTTADGPAARKFKFCYIVRGLPGSGKSTVARQLAGETGVVLDLDTDVVKHASSGEGGLRLQEQDSLITTQEKHF